MKAAVALVLLILMGCGGDDDGGGPDAEVPGADGAAPGADAPPAGEVGGADVTGTVAEQMIDPAAAFYGLHPFGGYDVLVMTEDASAFCNFEVDAAGLVAVVGFPCGAAAAGALLINPDVEAPCGEQPHVWFLVEGFEGETNEYLAGQGSVIITGADGQLIQGNFTADFGDKGELDGSFMARVCGAG